MKIKLSAIGKLKSGPEQELFNRYFERARTTGKQLGFSDISLREFAPSQVATTAQRKRQEEALLLSPVGNDSYMLALDENGQDISSTQFSQILATKRDAGLGELVLIIGGADGLSPELLENSDKTIRLGKMTWPHQLARILIMEQIYRAMTILSHHPYHRS